MTHDTLISILLLGALAALGLLYVTVLVIEMEERAAQRKRAQRLANVWRDEQ